MTEKIFPDVRPEVVAKFTEAERLVENKMGGAPTLEATMTDFVKSYKDQFIDVFFAGDIDRANEPYVVLSIYRVMRDAIDLYILNQMKLFGLDLTKDEIDYYLQHDIACEKAA